MSLDGKREADLRLARSWDAILGFVDVLGGVKMFSGENELENGVVVVQVTFGGIYRVCTFSEALIGG